MTTFTIYVQNGVDEYQPYITPQFRYYGNFVTNPGGDIINDAPAYYYLTGYTGITSYFFDRPGSLDYGSDLRYHIALGYPGLSNFGLVDTDDTIVVGGHTDSVFAGLGDDTITEAYGNPDGNLFVGGSGNDSITSSSTGNDIIYGDFADAPIYVSDTEWSMPTGADTNVVDGNDYIFGNYGADTLHGGGGADTLIGGVDTASGYNDKDVIDAGDGDDVIYGGTDADSLAGGDGDDQLRGESFGDTLNGGDGNDMLDGGPRGAGWLDVLTGGPGADAFLLSYTPPSPEDANDDQSFWQSWGADFVGDVGAGVVSTGVEGLTEAAAEAFFSTVGGGLLLGGLSYAIGGLTSKALGFLFHQDKSPPPQPTGNDIMIVTDFDPSEDVLFLPLADDDTTILDTNITNVAQTEVPGLSGWAIEFSRTVNNVSTLFAQVFISTDFLADFGITNSGDKVIEAFIDDVFDHVVTINEDGVEDTVSAYPFPTDPSSYTEGVVPIVAGAQLPFQAPSGTKTNVYGAFGPQITVSPTVLSNNTFVAGTSMGDLIFITVHGFAPDDWDNAPAVPQVTNSSVVLGYGGDDILNGSSGQDSLAGGDGDDVLYGWNAADAPNRDQLSGGNGNDLLSAAKPLGGRAAADFDGGDGADTASFAYSRDGLVASLTPATGQSYGTGKNAADTVDGAYTFTSIENLIGTALADTLTGDDNNNALNGGDGNDTIVGEAGNDTLLGGAGNDTITGGLGADSIDGGDGYDVIAFADNGTAGVIVSLAFATNGTWIDAFGFHDTVVLGTVEAYWGTSGADSMVGDPDNGTWWQSSADFYGMGGNDTLIGSGIAQTLDGGDGNDSLEGENGDDVLAGGSGNDSLDAGGGADTMTGGDGNDLLSGDDGNDNVDGGGGDDSLDGGSEADTMTGGDGNDALSGGDGADSLDGGDGNDNLDGNRGDDTLTGGAGADTMTGGDGFDVLAGTPDDLDGDQIEDFDTADDILRVLGPGTFQVKAIGPATQTVLEITDSNQMVLASVTLVGDFGGTFTATAATGYTDITYDASSLVLGSTGHDFMIGHALGNTLIGLAGNDTLDGGLGADLLLGGPGDDLYRIDDPLDLAIERPGEGADTVSGTVSLKLHPNIEAGVLSGGDDLHLRGNAGDNLLRGNAGANVLIGYDGADSLDGGAGGDRLRADGGADSLAGGLGEDTVLGMDGADTLDGGAGRDRLIGGTEADLFLFSAVPPSPGDADIIIDFELGLDRIGILGSAFLPAPPDAPLVAGPLDPSRFVANASGQATTPGLGTFVFETGAGRLWWDADGAGGEARDLVAILRGGVVLGAGDLIVV